MQTCGVYALQNITTGKAYVGSSINIEKRHYQHMVELKKGTHYNTALQTDWTTNPDNFTFQILEECERHQLGQREHYWSQHLDTYTKGYNHNNRANHTYRPGPKYQGTYSAQESDYSTWQAKEYKRCGRPTCKICKDGPGHGPYWYEYHYSPTRKLQTRRRMIKDAPTEST